MEPKMTRYNASLCNLMDLALELEKSKRVKVVLVFNAILGNVFIRSKYLNEATQCLDGEIAFMFPHESRDFVMGELTKRGIPFREFKFDTKERNKP